MYYIVSNIKKSDVGLEKCVVKYVKKYVVKYVVKYIVKCVEKCVESKSVKVQKCNRKYFLQKMTPQLGQLYNQSKKHTKKATKNQKFIYPMPINSLIKLNDHQIGIERLFRTLVPPSQQKLLSNVSSGFGVCGRPEYPTPGNVNISTMTITNYLSSLVHMKPVFYLIPLVEIDRLEETEKEKKYLNESTHKTISFYHALMAYVSSNQTQKGRWMFCPLTTFIRHFEKYYQKKLGYSPDYTYENYKTMFSSQIVPGFALTENPETKMYPPRKTGMSFTETKLSKTTYTTDYYIIGLDVDPIFPCITHIKYKDVERGYPHLGVKKKKKKRAFYNQCTMRIAYDGFDNITNLKVFKNGKLHMTGCKSLEDATNAVEYLLYQLEVLSYHMLLKNNTMKELSYKMTKTCVQLPDRLWHKILFRCNAWDLDRWTCLFPHLLDNKLFWLKKSEDDFGYKFKEVTPGHWKACEKYNERKNQFKKIFKSSIFDDPKQFYFSHHGEQEKMPFIPLEEGSIVRLIESNIELINTDFDIGFYLDQNVLTSILRGNPYNLFVKYDPLNYPGVNIKYPCRVIADKEKEISILVFRTGQVIITAGTCQEHIDDTYNFINGVFREHYEQLWVPSDEDE